MKTISFPPMGWNSYDCYGATVNEEEVKSIADFMGEHLKKYGWEYVVIDIQWYKPMNWEQLEDGVSCVHTDENGRLVPDPVRFPSSLHNLGFKPLAEYVHSKGLKFGIHIMRGIPKKAVHENMKIPGTQISLQDIANTESVCDWCPDMYGVDTDKQGAQEWYDSIAAQYIDWNVDFIKADDMTYPYSKGEIELLVKAITKYKPDLVLSLSPGPAPLNQVEHLKRHANMWRISADFWDRWKDLYNQFELCRIWSIHIGEGNWPDADMLPLGYIGFRCGINGEGGRMTRLTKAEQVTMFSLWCICRSPLMFGGDLQNIDPWTLSLLTNEEVLEIQKNSRNNRELFRNDEYIAWTASIEGCCYLAIFNLKDNAAVITTSLSELGLKGKYKIRDLWKKEDLGLIDMNITAEVSAHGARVFKVEPVVVQ